MGNFNRWNNANKIRRETGKRSGLEVAVAAQLDKLGVTYGYETEKIQYTYPAEDKWYSADFKLQNGLIIETKGEFTAKDRKKHLLIRQQYPEVDIRFVFSNPNQRISKTSKVTYADWCKKYDFLYAKGLIPQEWLKEPVKPTGCKEHKYMPDGMSCSTFQWKCVKCGHYTETERGHQ